MPTQ
ncbi:unnamed protein product, partial [Rotaria sordida]|jgi:hypothetical protein